jgi:hypothetical protein
MAPIMDRDESIPVVETHLDRESDVSPEADVHG